MYVIRTEVPPAFTARKELWRALGADELTIPEEGPTRRQKQLLRGFDGGPFDDLPVARETFAALVALPCLAERNLILQQQDEDPVDGLADMERFVVVYRRY